MAWSTTPRKVLVAYSKEDKKEAQEFIQFFAHRLVGFTPILIEMEEDLLYAGCPAYDLFPVRAPFLKDSEVTLVLLGKNTYRQKYIDRIIEASLEHGDFAPNGLLGVALPSVKDGALLPIRLRLNCDRDAGKSYAQYLPHPNSLVSLGEHIDDAVRARKERLHLINNPEILLQRGCRMH
ncbi:MAG: TIR domain-containing protein [Bacteroidota bacterium]